MSEKRLPQLKIGYTLQLTPEMMAGIEKCVLDCLPEVLRACLDEIDLEKMIEEKVGELLAEKEPESEIELVVEPKEDAVLKIRSYIDDHPDCTTSDIIYDLGLDPDLVLAVLDDLQRKGLIRGEPIE